MQPGDRLEVPVDGYVIDICRDDLLIEIQTANFTAMKRKLNSLLQSHTIRLVHPIAVERWLVKLEADCEQKAERRKSPRRGHVSHIFRELVRIPQLIVHPRFSLEILLIQEEEVRCPDPTIRKRWRRRGGWRVHDRRLLAVTDSVVISGLDDLCGLLPDRLPDSFTTADVASGLGQPRYIAQKMVYCLREAGALKIAGKQGNALVYVRSS
jgi:hypothetical protein